MQTNKFGGRGEGNVPLTDGKTEAEFIIIYCYNIQELCYLLFLEKYLRQEQEKDQGSVEDQCCRGTLSSLVCGLIFRLCAAVPDRKIYTKDIGINIIESFYSTYKRQTVI